MGAITLTGRNQMTDSGGPSFTTDRRDSRDTASKHRLSSSAANQPPVASSRSEENDLSSLVTVFSKLRITAKLWYDVFIYRQVPLLNRCPRKRDHAKFTEADQGTRPQGTQQQHTKLRNRVVSGLHGEVGQEGDDWPRVLYACPQVL